MTITPALYNLVEGNFQSSQPMKEESKMIYLKLNKFCVQYEMIFNDRAEVCPGCGSPSWMPLEKWLHSTEELTNKMLHRKINGENLLHNFIGTG